MRVIGTAGHVDHGKSALVEAITGIHPDRLQEEKEREMTIDLGFGWFSLPSGEEVGIVDVPGHRDFIENMLAGVGGIDIGVLVIAADDGVMPQTREHLAILDLLEIPKLVVALNKIDLVDEEWLALVEEDIETLLLSTRYGGAPIVKVSAVSNEGIDELVKAIDATLQNLPERVDKYRPRLSVDRVFTLTGFGTVVTGTLIDGSFKIGDVVEVLPQKIQGRIRGLQSHKKKVEIALPGSRTAVNLSGVNVEQIKRGDVIALPGTYRSTRRLDAKLKVLDDLSITIKHNMPVKFFIGASEVIGRIRLLGTEQLLPGEEGWIQIETQRDIVAYKGDHFILRRPSPGATLGGGVILNPHPKGRYKRFEPSVIENLARWSSGSPDKVIRAVLEKHTMLSLDEIRDMTGLDESQCLAVLNSESSSADIKCLGSKKSDGFDLYTVSEQWNSFVQLLKSVVRAYHQANPLLRGMNPEELRSKLKLSSDRFDIVIKELLKDGILVKQGKFVALSDHKILLTPEQKQILAKLIMEFEQHPYSPPTIKQCQDQVGEDLYQYLITEEKLIAVSNEIVFTKQAMEQAKRIVREKIKLNGSINVSGLRDALKTSRKYALPLLEYLDAIGFTKRRGDERVLGPNAESQ